MNVWYHDETGRKINFELKDEDCLYHLAQQLLDAPIDLEYLDSDTRTFNLNTFEWC